MLVVCGSVFVEKDMLGANPSAAVAVVAESVEVAVLCDMTVSSISRPLGVAGAESPMIVPDIVVLDEGSSDMLPNEGAVELPGVIPVEERMLPEGPALLDKPKKWLKSGDATKFKSDAVMFSGKLRENSKSSYEPGMAGNSKLGVAAAVDMVGIGLDADVMPDRSHARHCCSLGYRRGRAAHVLAAGTIERQCDVLVVVQKIVDGGGDRLLPGCDLLKRNTRFRSLLPTGSSASRV